MKTGIKYLNFNGEIIPEVDLKILPSNRSFRYADGLFESIRMRNGHPLFVEAHIHRLFSGMKILKMTFSSEVIPDFEKLIFETCQANEIIAGGYARLMIYRKGKGKYLPETDEVDFIIEVFPLPNEFSWTNTDLYIGVYSDMKKPVNFLSSLKSNNAQLYILAAHFAQNHGFGDVLILNENNKIIEATSSNLFWIDENILKTPPLVAGPLPGIMRNEVISIAKKMGYVIEENCPSQDDLLNADEVFLTNAIIGLKPVSGFQEKRYYADQCLKIVKELNNS